jgi:hypothetical protein
MDRPKVLFERRVSVGQETVFIIRIMSDSPTMVEILTDGIGTPVLNATAAAVMATHLRDAANLIQSSWEVGLVGVGILTEASASVRLDHNTKAQTQSDAGGEDNTP